MKKPILNRNLVFRADAEINILITLVSFAASISITRAFLFLTGYPQLGNSELHISHLLWGGLLMFAGLLALLLFSNRWIHSMAAILSGVGIGLFIDEVGKFITQTNDYFYPVAAPVIYSFFLLTLLLFLIVRRRRKPDAREVMHEVLEQLTGYLDNDLSDVEAAELVNKLQRITRQDGHKDIQTLAQSLLVFFHSEHLVHSVHKDTLLERINKFYDNEFPRIFPRKRMRIILAGTWVAWGIWTLVSPVKVIINRPDEIALMSIIEGMVDANLIAAASSQLLFQLRLWLSISLGLLIIIAAFVLLIKKDRIAASIAFWVFLISLTLANMLMFYFDQFSTIFNAAIQFLLLITLIAYQRKYLAADSATI
jgi:ABC-type multidrug transport system fused ATPase/permease subunit